MARTITRRQALAGAAFAYATGGRAFGQDAEDPDLWPELARLFFDGRQTVEDAGLVSFEAPARAEDAALVPMSFSARLPDGDPRRVVKLTLVIDQNPVPLDEVRFEGAGLRRGMGVAVFNHRLWNINAFPSLPACT